MIKYLIFFILLFSFYTFAGEAKLKVELANKDNNLRLYLINYGDDVLVNTRFSLKPYPKFPPEVQFEIVNKEGKKFPFGPISLDGPSIEEKDIVLLGKRHFVGVEFHITNLIMCHHLKPGTYKARVTYENARLADKGVYVGRLTSNWVSFEVPEKDEDIVWPEREFEK